jgi:hypothetical protein
VGGERIGLGAGFLGITQGNGDADRARSVAMGDRAHQQERGSDRSMDVVE